MAEVTIEGEELVLTIQGMRRLWSLKSELRIPLAHVRGATADPGLSTRFTGFSAVAEWPGRKVIGSDWYGRYLGGTFTQDGDRVFWDVADPAKAIVISADWGEFRRLYIEAKDPEGTVAMIEAALAARAAGAPAPE
ncbi:hypothetical protein [Leucobacter massiliensis]|uniref:Bacterial Pleckstrin homology domain-containing protein n=1 Tax=Leucobacter massiliensis TaxID=1686285 RepID=A0A2S9QR29_9MICO|nr:hypothetical protein [Leucobacter massiliensis]PRI12039.1 hypothetical protein B4915_02950 [Leucobacter massiliensis]